MKHPHTHLGQFVTGLTLTAMASASLYALFRYSDSVRGAWKRVTPKLYTVKRNLLNP